MLALAADAAATPNQVAEVCIARIRLGLAGGDHAAVADAARILILESPTTDAAKSTPAFVRQAAAQAERNLTPAERGRRGSALVADRDARRGVRLLSQDRPAAWPEGERSRNLLALAQGQLALKKPKDAEATAARIPDDGTLASAQARLLRCDLVVARLRGKDKAALAHDDPRLVPVHQALDALTAPSFPIAVRRGAAERLVKLDAEGEDFDGALARARLLTSDAPATIDGFEPLWLAAWRRYLAGDYAGALARFDAMALRLRRHLALPPAGLLECAVPRGRGQAGRGARGVRASRSRHAARHLRAVCPCARAGRARPRAAGARRPVHGDRRVRAGGRAPAPADVRGGVGRGAYAAALARPGSAHGAGGLRARALPDRRDRDQARAPGDRHRRRGARARGLAAALLPDRGRRHSRRAREGGRGRSRGAARSRAAGERLRRAREVARGRGRADAADAGDREKPLALGPALALPQRLSLRPGLERRARGGVPEAAHRPVRRLDRARARGLQRRPVAHRPHRPRESPAGRGRALRDDPAVRDAGLRPRRVLLYSESYRELYP